MIFATLFTFSDFFCKDGVEDVLMVCTICDLNNILTSCGISNIHQKGRCQKLQ